jgi:hypothetical protein
MMPVILCGHITVPKYNPDFAFERVLPVTDMDVMD